MDAPSTSSAFTGTLFLPELDGLEQSDSYGCRYGNANDVASFRKHIEDTRSIAGGRPIWVTEFNARGDDNEVGAFLTDVMSWIDASRDIHRYAYFMAAPGILISPDGKGLSDLGKKYTTFNSTAPSTTPETPPSPDPSSPSKRMALQGKCQKGWCDACNEGFCACQPCNGNQMRRAIHQPPASEARTPTVIQEGSPPLNLEIKAPSTSTITTFGPDALRDISKRGRCVCCQGTRQQKRRECDCGGGKLVKDETISDIVSLEPQAMIDIAKRGRSVCCQGTRQQKCRECDCGNGKLDVEETASDTLVFYPKALADIKKRGRCVCCQGTRQQKCRECDCGTRRRSKFLGEGEFE